MNRLGVNSGSEVLDCCGEDLFIKRAAPPEAAGGLKGRCAGSDVRQRYCPK